MPPKEPTDEHQPQQPQTLTYNDIDEILHRIMDKLDQVDRRMDQQSQELQDIRDTLANHDCDIANLKRNIQARLPEAAENFKTITQDPKLEHEEIEKVQHEASEGHRNMGELQESQLTAKKGGPTSKEREEMNKNESLHQCQSEQAAKCETQHRPLISLQHIRIKLVEKDIINCQILKSILNMDSIMNHVARILISSIFTPTNKRPHHNHPHNHLLQWHKFMTIFLKL